MHSHAFSLAHNLAMKGNSASIDLLKPNGNLSFSILPVLLVVEGFYVAFSLILTISDGVLLIRDETASKELRC